MKIHNKYLNYFLSPSVVSIIVIFGVWLFLIKFQLIGKSLIASPGEVAHSIFNGFNSEAARSEKIHVHAAHSIGRAVQGWSYSLFAGALIGSIIGSRKWIYELSEPGLEFIRAIPPVLAFPLFLVAFNFSYEAYIWTIVFGCVPIMSITVARGITSISANKISILKIYNVPLQSKALVVIMEILPSLFLGGRLCLSIALIVAVVSEMVFTPRSGYGIGSLARDAQIDFNTPVFYGCVVTIGLFGFFANIMLRWCENIFQSRDQSRDGFDKVA